MLQIAESGGLVRGALRATIVESSDDYDALKAAGFRSVVVAASVGDVVELGQDGEPQLRSHVGMFTEFVLALRRGSEALRDALALRLGDTRCRWVAWPDGYGTAASLAHSEGVAALADVVARARPMWTDEVSRLSDIPEPAEQQAYSCGIKGIDQHGFRIVRPCLWTVVGPYGSGKSILARQLVANFWNLHGWRTLITSLEERVKPRMRRDFRRHFSPHAHTIMTSEDDAAADKVTEQAVLFLRRPRREDIDADRLFARIEYAVHVYGIDCVVIDPINEIDHRVPKGESKTEYMGRFIMRLKALADDYNLVAMVLAHPPKDGVAMRNSTGKIYTLNDAADTAHFGNKSDIGWCVWRPMRDFDDCGPRAPTFLNIDKLKDHDVMGRPTLATLQLGANGQFHVDKTGLDALQAIKGDE